MFIQQKPLYTNLLAPVWDKIPTRFINILTVRLKGTDVTVTPQRQFDIFYKNRSLVYTIAEDAQEAFLMIFFGTRAQLLLEQIDQAETQLIRRLTNLEIWSDNTKTTIENIGGNATVTTTKALNVNRGGNTDGNSLMNKELVNEHFNLEQPSPIPPNLLNQNLTDDTGKIETAGKVLNNTVSSVGVSNESDDIMAFLRLELPDLRQKFWGLFHCLFNY